MFPPFAPFFLSGALLIAFRLPPGEARLRRQPVVFPSSVQALGGLRHGNFKRRSSPRRRARAARVDRRGGRALSRAAERDSRGGRQGGPARPLGRRADGAPPGSRQRLGRRRPAAVALGRGGACECPPPRGPPLPCPRRMKPRAGPPKGTLPAPRGFPHL